MQLQPSDQKRARRAWYWYDFGNSAYAAVILLAIYPVYFKNQVVGGNNGTLLWGVSLGIAMLVVALISPVLGIVADLSGARKRFLLIFTLMAWICTGLLFFVQQGTVLLGMALFILAEIGYRTAQVFYNAMLPDIAAPQEMGRVSGIGWAIGSAGGVICLLIILPLVVIFQSSFVTRLAFMIAALFFALSTLPLFLWMGESGVAHPLPAGETYLSLSLKQLAGALRRAHTFREFVKFVIAFLVYDNGVMMMLDFAAIIGAVLYGMDQTAMVVFIIVVQTANIVGAYLFGIVADRVSAKSALLVALGIMAGATVAMFAAHTQTAFFVIGSVAGFAMAGVQSLSRTFVSLFSPAERSAEFYGFFSTAGRATSFIGPAFYGWVAAQVALVQTSLGLPALAAEQMGQRVAVLFIGLFLVIGLLLLCEVNGKITPTDSSHVDNPV